MRAAIAGGQRPPVWRQIQLDARDALDLGRYEDCVVLGWAALEAACRRALPGLAHNASLTPDGLVTALRRLGGTTARATYSHEGVVRSVSAGLPIVELTAELVNPRIYDPASLRMSVEAAHRLRNVIVHQGARVDAQDAKRTLDAVDLVLNSVLPLREVSPPPATLSWTARFGRVSKRIRDFVNATGVRLVVWRAPQDANFEWEVFEDDLWLRFERNVTSAVAEVLLLAEWNAWVRSGSRGEYPHLQVGQPSGILLQGLVSLEADRVEHSVCVAEALQALERVGIATTKMAGESVRTAVSALAKGARLQIPDPGLPIRAAQIAAHLSVLPRRGWNRRLAALRTSQPDVYRLAMAWASKMAELPHSDAHARCDVLQLISANSAWLDGILVICPIEQVAYGSRRWPLTAAPL